MGPSAPTAETTQPYPVSAISVPEEPVELGQETAGSADGSASASLTPPDAEPSAETTQVASIMRSMSWGSSLHQAGGLVEPPRPSEAGQPAGQHSLVSELHARAAAQAAAAIGLSPSAAMAASHMLPDMQSTAQAALTISSMAPVQLVAAEVAAGKAAESQLLVLDDGGVLPGEEGGEPAAGEQAFTCTVCRKVFKREMNLVFHMTTHRPKQPRAMQDDHVGVLPITCQDCGKTFGTKYQAKKHYLRRHFEGEKPYPCSRCGKRFVVKEDLTMHMKSCGHVYSCECGIRLCSLGALKRHCKHFGHEPGPSLPGGAPIEPPDSPDGTPAKSVTPLRRPTMDRRAPAARSTSSSMGHMAAAVEAALHSNFGPPTGHPSYAPRATAAQFLPTQYADFAPAQPAGYARATHLLPPVSASAAGSHYQMMLPPQASQQQQMPPQLLQAMLASQQAAAQGAYGGPMPTAGTAHASLFH